VDRLEPLAEVLGELDSEGLSLPQETTRTILELARDRHLPFDEAWAMAVNRIQPSQLGGVVQPELDSELREQRALLEEVRPHWRAAYEGGEPTVVERAETVVSTWSRLEGPVPLHYRESPSGNGVPGTLGRNGATTAEPSSQPATSHTALLRHS
jgi:hypothetical protein